MSQEILQKLEELKAGQISSEQRLSRRLDEVQEGLKAIREHDLPLVLKTVEIVKGETSKNQVGIERLARMIETLADKLAVLPRAVRG
jgi:hypothetical protein